MKTLTQRQYQKLYDMTREIAQMSMRIDPEKNVVLYEDLRKALMSVELLCNRYINGKYPRREKRGRAE